MKIYNNGSYGRATIFVTPGRDHPENSDWIKVGRDGEGREIREPLQITVKFENGVADVPDGLGRYLVAKQMARRSPIIQRTDLDAGVPVRPAPMSVGRPLNELAAL